MNVFLLYLLLLKATIITFSGLASLPVIREDLVVHYGVLTDRELNMAVAAGQLGPGPIGSYVVSAGYLAAGLPGAIAGWMAMITPAFLILPMLRYMGSRAKRPGIRRMIRGVTIAAAGLILASAVPLAQSAISGPLTLAIAVSSFLALAFTRIDSIWIMAASAAAASIGPMLV
ncbi:MAG: chromate transporter [Bryobacteraceae bacterium]|nr:chromate transporter [Bryobacteraceae bacterium]